MRAEKNRGRPIREIARVLGISRNTVSRLVNLDSPPVYPQRTMRSERRLTESLIT